MKNIAIFLLIVLSASSFSCDFLEEEPKGLISDTYAKTEEGVESLILSIYQRNRYLTERLYKFADCGTDLTTYATNGVGWPYEEAMIYNDPLMISNRWNSQYCIIRKTKNSSFKNEKSKKEVDVAITVSNKDIV